MTTVDAVAPMGEVPAPELDDGTILSEVTAICEYPEEKRPSQQVALL
jgi:glutathione S-transferase